MRLPHPTVCPTQSTALPSPRLSGFRDINITYSSPRGDDLDSRLLRAMVSPDHGGCQAGGVILWVAILWPVPSGRSSAPFLLPPPLRLSHILPRFTLFSLPPPTAFTLFSLPSPPPLPCCLLQVIKGILEASTTARVNLVNADLLARNRGFK